MEQAGISSGEYTFDLMASPGDVHSLGTAPVVKYRVAPQGVVEVQGSQVDMKGVAACAKTHTSVLAPTLLQVEYTEDPVTAISEAICRCADWQASTAWMPPASAQTSCV